LRATGNRPEVPLKERKAKKGKNLTDIFWVPSRCRATSRGGQAVDYEKIATAAVEGMAAENYQASAGGTGFKVGHEFVLRIPVMTFYTWNGDSL
jgi:hypothetical protein